MANLASTDIQVFPCTKRGDNQRSARLFSEENVSRISRVLLDKQSFVITDTFDASKPFEFILGGYYFKVSTGSALTNAVSSVGDIYAKITLSGTTVGDDTYYEIYGQDASGSYQGLDLVSLNPGNSDTVKSLLLLTDSVIPSSSKQKYAVENICGDIPVIDGGTVS